ncbi:MAG: hypothetical protein KBT18_04680, partial [Comamonas sp.]|nr:hypothetical protein [Candidatus Comamonas equi]
PPAPSVPVTPGGAEMVRQGALLAQLDNTPDSRVGPNAPQFATMSGAGVPQNNTRAPLLTLAPNFIAIESEQ